MCELCRKSICPGACPNAPEPPLYGECEVCGEPIYDGDECYELGDHLYCEACVHRGYKTAEVEYD